MTKLVPEKWKSDEKRQFRKIGHDSYLGIMLFASSASAGQRFAICAVSNCVRFGSRRRVLDRIKKKVIDENYRKAANCELVGLLSHSTRRVRGIEFGKSLHVLKGFVIHTAIIIIVFR